MVQVSWWSKNTALCALTEAVIFTEPYFDVAHNRWTSPQLDQEVQAIRSDLELKQAIGKLKAKFVDNTEALLHGDLHTGSVMVKEGNERHGASYLPLYPWLKLWKGSMPRKWRG